MSRRLVLDGDVTIEGPSGRGRVTASDGRVEVAAEWRLLLAVVLSGRLRRIVRSAAGFLRRSGVRVRLRLPGLPALGVPGKATGLSLLLLASAGLISLLLS